MHNTCRSMYALVKRLRAAQVCPSVEEAFVSATVQCLRGALLLLTFCTVAA